MFKKETKNLGYGDDMTAEVVNEDYAGDLVYLNDIDVIPLSQFGSDLLVFNESVQEETLDVANVVNKFDSPHNEVFPFSPRGPPERLNFQGTLNFEVQIDGSDTHKRKYLYSHKLNRIYVDMKTNFLVQFKWVPMKWTNAMYVRAMTVFSDEAQAEKRVERCLTHSADSTSTDLKIVKNVLHSAREFNTQGVHYCGDPNLPDSWYSVVVEFPSSSSETSPKSHAYQFVCKNSCSSGINRRSIAIIFTLEDAMGRAHGRQTVGVRVCACPKRDIKRDERLESDKGCENVTKHDRKRKMEPAAESKRIKLETVLTPGDEELLVTPAFHVAGSYETIKSGLSTLIRLMELEKQAKKKDSESIQNFIIPMKKYLDDLKKKSNHTSNGYLSF